MAKKKSTTQKGGSATPPAASGVRIVIDGTPRDLRIPLTLIRRDGTGRCVVMSGERANVEPGDYTVTGAYAPTEDGRVFGGRVYTAPPFTVIGSVAVSPLTDECLVGMTYDCFALVVDPGKASGYRVRGYAGAMIDLNWMADAGGVMVAYVSGSWSYPGLTLSVVPAGQEGRGAVYELVTDPSGEGALVQYGKWYSFGPDGAVSGDLADLLTGREAGKA